MCVPQRQMFIDLTKKGKIVKKYIDLETKLETSFHNGPPRIREFIIRLSIPSTIIASLLSILEIR